MGDENKNYNQSTYADEEIVEIDDTGQIVTIDRTGQRRLGVRPPAHTFY